MGKFIVIEGSDGSGKTSQSKALASALSASWECFPDRTTFIGHIIDLWLKQKWSAKFNPLPTLDEGLEAEKFEPTLDAAVFQALQTVNRMEHAHRIDSVKRSLWGRAIVCDRYWPSGVAYGTADGLDYEFLCKVHQTLPEPDVCVLIDTPLSTIMDRLSQRSGAKRDHYELKGQAYFETIHATYDRLWKERSVTDPRWVRLTPSESFEETQWALQTLVKKMAG